MNFGDFILYYLEILLYTLGLLVICGLVAELLRRLFSYLIGNSLGYKAIIATAWIGTPVHEIGHALMCIIFGHKIVDMKLYQFDRESGTLGYVQHTHNPRNLYQKLGNLFIGMGPIFSGIGVITLVLFLCFPSAFNTFFTQAFGAVSGGDFTQALSQTWQLPVNMFTGGEEWWMKVIGFIVIFSVTMHVTLSPADIKNSLGGFGLYLLLALAFAGISMIFGVGFVTDVREALQIFALYCGVLYLVFYIFAAAILLLSLIIFILKKVLVRR